MKCYTYNDKEFYDKLTELSAKEFTQDYLVNLRHAQRIPWLNNKRINEELGSVYWMRHVRDLHRQSFKNLKCMTTDKDRIKRHISSYLYIFC